MRLVRLAAAADDTGEARWCPHTPTARQAEFLTFDGLEALYGGAAGGGKSDALLMGALQHVDMPGYSAILFRRTHTDLALPGAIMDRAHEWLAGTAAHWADRDKCWTFPNGATLTFGYLDGPRDRFRYQSAEFQYIGFDEVTQFEERDYLYLFSRLRRTGEIAAPLRMRAATNPGGIGHEWVKRRFIDSPESRVFMPAKLEDNPHLDRAEYETALNQLDPVTRQQLRDGLWIRDPSGLVYSSWDDARNTTACLPPLPEGEQWTKILACDFGVVDPTAFAVWAFCEHDPCAYLLESDQWTDLAPSEAAEIAREWDRRHGGFAAMVGDVGGLGKGFEAEWRKRFHLPLRAAKKNDKLGYIKLFNGALHNGTIRALPWANEQLIADLRALPWADEQHTREHPGSPNHLSDCALYGWRESRSWAWEPRVVPPSDEAGIRLAQVEARKSKLAERNRRRQSDTDNEWIWND